MWLGIQTRQDFFNDAVRRNAVLLQRITITNRHGAIGQGVAIHSDTVWRADLVLTTITAADGSLLVKLTAEACCL